MADTFKGIVTADGKKRQLPYGSILDIPKSDPSLTVEGGFADAAVVGKKNKKTDETIASLKEDMDNVAINGIYQHNYVLSWEQGKFKYESGLISYGAEKYAIHSNFINISEINKPINIYIPDGIQIFAL